MHSPKKFASIIWLVAVWNVFPVVGTGPCVVAAQVQAEQENTVFYLYRFASLPAVELPEEVKLFKEILDGAETAAKIQIQRGSILGLIAGYHEVTALLFKTSEDDKEHPIVNLAKPSKVTVTLRAKNLSGEILRPNGTVAGTYVLSYAEKAERTNEYRLDLRMILVGTLMFDDGTVYSIQPFRDGQHILRKTSSSSQVFDPGEPHYSQDDDLPKPVKPGQTGGKKTDKSKSRQEAEPAQSPADLDEAEPVDEGKINIAIFYTTRVKECYGGNLAAELVAENCVATFNSALYNSDIAETEVQGVLVHTSEVTEYNETETALLYQLVDSDPDGVLEHFRKKNDGYMNSVHSNRKNAEADLACLLIHDKKKGYGVAYRMKDGDQAAEKFAPLGFSVVNITSISGPQSPTFAHELAHNFGCSHVWDTSVDLFEFCHPHEYTTTDSMGTSTTSVTLLKTGNRSLRYSNPLKEVLGVETGSAYRNNAKVIQETAPTIKLLSTQL